MPEPNSKKLSFRDIVSIIVSLIVIGSFIGAQAVTNSKVNKNTETLEKYNLQLMEYRLNEMDEKLDRIIDILEDE